VKVPNVLDRNLDIIVEKYVKEVVNFETMLSFAATYLSSAELISGCSITSFVYFIESVACINPQTLYLTPKLHSSRVKK